MEHPILWDPPPKTKTSPPVAPRKKIIIKKQKNTKQTKKTNKVKKEEHSTEAKTPRMDRSHAFGHRPFLGGGSGGS